MPKKRQTILQKAGKAMATGLTLAIFIIPTFVAGWWFASTAHSDDPRKTMPIAVFRPRAVDVQHTPLAPFKEPVVSVTFDDGWESVYTQAFPILQRDGIRTTQYIITNTMSNPLYMSVGQLKLMQQAGHQIGSHTVTHPDLTTLDGSALVYELAASQKVLQQEFGVKVMDFTSPYGAYNTYTLHMISRYYRSQKNAEGTADPSDNPLDTINVASKFKPLNFVSFSVRNDTTSADIMRLIHETQAVNGWLVLTYHQVDKSGEEYSVTPAMFAQQMAAVRDASMRSATVGQFMDAYFGASKL